MSAACGLFLAPGSLGATRTFLCLFGFYLVVAAANTINCFMERDVDALMTRTKTRPLVVGTLPPWTAIAFGLAQIGLGTYLLWTLANPLTAGLGFLGFILYIAVYTPMKRSSMMALFAGAIPGAIPPLMGWTAQTGTFHTVAWILFGILFFWQLPHFIAISLFREKEYTNAGLKTFPGSLGEHRAKQHMLAYTGFLLIVTFLPFPLGFAGLYYFATALLLGLLFSWLCFASFFKHKPLNWSRIIFFGSLAYLPLVLGMWVLDQILTRSIAA